MIFDSLQPEARQELLALMRQMVAKQEKDAAAAEREES